MMSINTLLNSLNRQSRVLLGVFLLSASAVVFAYEDIDKAVAVVENQVILQSELDQRLAHLSNKQPDIEINDRVKRQVLDQLVIERIQLNIAERVNLAISDAEVNKSMARLRNRLINENVEFDRYLAEQKMDEAQLRQAIRQDITLQKIQEGNINNRMRITDREIDEFLNSEAGKEWLQTRYRLAHILLTVDGNEAAVIEQADTLRESALKAQEPFQALAAQYSKGPNASKGGDLGWRLKDELPPLFLEQIANLDEGDITPPFRSNAGIHLLQVMQRGGAKPVMVERYKVRHILIQPTALFTDAEAKAKINELFQQLMDGADFASLAKQHTEDTGSKADGGDLGWSTPGKFVPAFERTMEATPVGQISEPFRSQFGWHILKVDDSRVEDMFDVVKRNQVANILRQRRFQDELQLWLQELRENTYVEVLI